MNGKLGSIHAEGRQVGGFQDWELEVVMASTRDGTDRNFQPRGWRIDAKAFWILEPLPEDVYEFRIYDRFGSCWRGNGAVVCETGSVIDRLIHQPLTARGKGLMEAMHGAKSG